MNSAGRNDPEAPDTGRLLDAAVAAAHAAGGHALKNWSRRREAVQTANAAVVEAADRTSKDILAKIGPVASVSD